MSVKPDSTPGPCMIGEDACSRGISAMSEFRGHRDAGVISWRNFCPTLPHLALEKDQNNNNKKKKTGILFTSSWHCAVQVLSCSNPARKLTR